MTHSTEGSIGVERRTDPASHRLTPGLIVLWTIVVLGAVAVLIVSSSVSASAFGVPVVIALLLAGVQAAAMVLSLVNPPIAAALSVVSLLAFALVTPPGGPWPVMVTSMIAHVSVVLLVTRRQWITGLAAVAAAGLGAAVVAFVSPVPETVQGAALADVIVFASVSAVAWLVGLLLGRWTAVRAQLVRERAVSAEELARREAVEERTRLARELHDVVAHGMSAIQVQASSARYRVKDLPPQALEEFEGIAALARTSMSEMRALLAVLRNEGAEAEGAPQPTAADVPHLIDSARRSGSRVELDDRLTAAEVAGFDPVLSLTVYRIVQESLSNVARHATGADVLVTLDRVGDTMRIEVRNAPPPAGQLVGAVPDAGGHGIRGMRERVDLHHGTLEALPTGEGGFVVRVTLPLV
jgi:signal transduction histidine kinase